MVCRRALLADNFIAGTVKATCDRPDGSGPVCGSAGDAFQIILTGTASDSSCSYAVGTATAYASGTCLPRPQVEVTANIAEGSARVCNSSSSQVQASFNVSTRYDPLRVMYDVSVLGDKELAIRCDPSTQVGELESWRCRVVLEHEGCLCCLDQLPASHYYIALLQD